MLALVLRVSLECFQDLLLLARVKRLSRDDRNLFLTIQLLVELLVLVGNTIDEDKALVLSQDLEELVGRRVEISNRLESLIELSDFFRTHSSVLSKIAEGLRVLVKRLQVDNVLVYGVKSALGRSGGKKNGSVATLHRVLRGWRLVIRGTLDLRNIADGKGAE